MKKLLIAGIAALSLMSVPASAGNEGALIGGLLGGIIIGGMINDNHRHGHYYEEYHYNYPQSPRCRIVWERVWDNYEGYYRDVPRKICRRYY